MTHINGRFYISEDFDTKEFKLGLLWWKDDKRYQLKLDIPKEAIKIVEDIEVQFMPSSPTT